MVLASNYLDGLDFALCQIDYVKVSHARQHVDSAPSKDGLMLVKVHDIERAAPRRLDGFCR